MDTKDFENLPFLPDRLVESFLVHPLFARIAEYDALGNLTTGDYMKDSGGTGVTFVTNEFMIHNRRSLSDLFRRMPPVGVGVGGIYILVADSRWLRFILRVKVYSRVYWNVFVQNILFTLHIWGLAEHDPGAIMTVSDVKIVKWIKSKFLGERK